ncbi:MAG TPA: hypothetical protein VGM03_22135, partial [Phycisphaerae bacterium]
MAHATRSAAAVVALLLAVGDIRADGPWVIEPIAMGGDPVPGFPGAFFSPGGVAGLTIDNSGAVAFFGVWGVPPNPQIHGLFYGTPGNVQPVLVQGQPAPGFPGPNQLIQLWPGQIPYVTRSGILSTAPTVAPQPIGVPTNYVGPPGSLALIAYQGGPPPGLAS